MKTKMILTIYIAPCILLSGCSKGDNEGDKAMYYCKGLGYSGGYIYDTDCVGNNKGLCTTTYMFSCYNVIRTGTIGTALVPIISK